MHHQIGTALELVHRRQRDVVDETSIDQHRALRRVEWRQLPGDLRARLDSTDIVQAAWLDVLRHYRDGAWHFDDAAHLRAFLVKVTRNRFLQDLRHHQKSLKHEQPLEAMKHDELPASRCVQPGEEASASELWSRLLHLCPPPHRPIPRRPSRPVAATARWRSGLPPPSSSC